MPEPAASRSDDRVLVNAMQHHCGTLNRAMDRPFFGCSRQPAPVDAKGSGFVALFKMSIGRILFFLWIIAPAAHAQLLGPRLADDPNVLLKLPNSMRLELGLTPSSASSLGVHSSVFTSDYWTRAYDERAQIETRFGVHIAAGPLWRPFVAQQTPIPGHPQFNFVQELRWPGGPLTGLQFERKNLLFQGDRLSIRATSDLQTLFRGAGMAGSETEVGLLSMLGWRSHSRLVWELGEPTRELRWQLSAGFDRRAYTQSSSLDLQVLRRF